MPHGVRTSRLLFTLCGVVLLTSLTGCSLFVMAGKAIIGDPMVTSPFRSMTGIDLTKGDDSVLIICSAPQYLISQFPALQIDIVDRVSRNMESKNIKVVPSGDVARWYDDHGEWGDYSELTTHFKAKYVMHIDMRTFQYRVPDSENLLHGKAEGHIRVHEISGSKKSVTSKKDYVPVRLAFDRNFSVTFPTAYPVPRESQSEDQFQQAFTDRVALHIGQHVYDYQHSETVH